MVLLYSSTIEQFKSALPQRSTRALCVRTLQLCVHRCTHTQPFMTKHMYTTIEVDSTIDSTQVLSKVVFYLYTTAVVSCPCSIVLSTTAVVLEYGIVEGSVLSSTWYSCRYTYGRTRVPNSRMQGQLRRLQRILAPDFQRRLQRIVRGVFLDHVQVLGITFSKMYHENQIRSERPGQNNSASGFSITSSIVWQICFRHNFSKNYPQDLNLNIVQKDASSDSLQSALKISTEN